MAAKKKKKSKKKVGSWMKKCARKWRGKSEKFRRTHKWKAFMKKHC